MSQRPIFAPDEIVQNIIDEISFRKGKITIKELWTIASSYIDLHDDLLKSFLYNNVVSHPDTIILLSGKVTPDIKYEDITQYEESLQIGITDDRLWFTLTGHTKKEASVVGFAFDLLLEVAASKEKGINTMELARNTGQDPRSVTGRIKKFAHLVTTTQLVFKGHLVKLLRLNRFVTEKPKKPYINIKQHLSDIVSTVKNSKNGVRQVIDLKREMGFDKEKRLSKAFTSAITWLDQQQYLKKVIVVSPTNPAIKIRCVQFLQDYIPEDMVGNEDFENDSMYEDDDDNDLPEEDAGEEDMEKNALEDDDLLEGFDKMNATKLLQESNLVIQDTPKDKKEVMINRFYPMQTQVYAIAEKFGTEGVSTMDLISNFVGPDYKRCFSKNSEYFIEGTSKKSSKTISDDSIGLVKIYDFEGKKKFHRIFTKDSFAKLTGQKMVTKASSNLPLVEEQPYNLRELSKMNFVPLNASLRYTNDGNQDIFFWHGELDIPASSKSSVRGRKRITLPDTGTEKPKRIKMIEPEVELKIEPNQTIKQSHSITVNGFTGNSLKSIQRQKALLTVLKQSGGARYIGDQLYDSISKNMGSDMLVDKKTLKKESEILVISGKLKIVEDPNSGKKILCLPETDDEKIQEYIIASKDSRGKFNAQVVRKEDIYFFDQNERDRFHRTTKSAKRIKEFERKNKKDRTPKIDVSISETPKTTTKKLPKAKKSKKSLSKEAKEDQPLLEKPENLTPIFHLGTKQGSRALVYAVAITKSIKGQILWEEITKLFPYNAVDNLRKQWTIKRVRMGAAGWRALMEKWRKVMVNAIKDETAALADAENLDLPKLVHLWLNVESETKQSIKLYKDYQANHRKYTFVPLTTKSRADSKGRGIAMSSMIQRENFLLNKTYSLEIEKPTEASDVDDEIRAVVRSMLFDKNTVDSVNLSSLQSFNHEQIDKVILDMAKERLLTFVDSSKLQLTEKIYELLKYRGESSFIVKASKFRKQLFELFGSKEALVISEEPQGHIPCVLIDLLESKKIKSQVVPLEVQHTKMYYTTRQYEVGALTPPLIFFSSNNPKDMFEERADIPMNKPFSRLWINSKAEIRQNVWKSVVSMVIKEIFFNPGVTLSTLHARFKRVLSSREISDILDWLFKTNRLEYVGPHGYIASDAWYYALG